MYGSSFSSLVSGLSRAKGLIKFKQVVFAHTLDNLMVSNSVFKAKQEATNGKYHQRFVRILRQNTAA